MIMDIFLVVAVPGVLQLLYVVLVDTWKETLLSAHSLNL